MMIVDWIKVIVYKVRISGIGRLAVLYAAIAIGYFTLSWKFSVAFSDYANVLALFLAVLPIAYVASRPVLPKDALEILDCISASGKQGCTTIDIRSKSKMEANKVNQVLLHLKELGAVKEAAYNDAEGKKSTRYKLWLFG